MQIPSDNGSQIRRVTWIGLWINVALALGKLTAGLLGHSRALVADAIHTISDFSTDIAVLIGSHYWNQPPDKEHPYGHRRIETMISIAIGLALASVGVLLVIDAIRSMHHAQNVRPSWLAAGAAAISVLIKELLYRYTARAGHRLKSAALTANAWHHRSDAISSIPVLLTVIFSRIFPDLSFLDAIGAIVVGVFILQAAIQIAWPGISEVIDRGASQDVRSRLNALACTVPGVQGVHDLRTRYSGNFLHVDLHIELNPGLTLMQAHAIGDQVRDALKNSDMQVMDVLIHLDPYNDHAEEHPGENQDSSL